MNYKKLEKICSLCGSSGDEKAVREYIISEIKDYTDSYFTDPLGNLIVHKKGKQKPEKKVMFAAHMDEVGFMITGIKSDGTLAFDAVGGIDADVVIGRQVYIPYADCYGVTGTKPIHRLSKKQREEAPVFSSMYIDIGAENEKEAKKLIPLGTYAYFADEMTKLGGNKICSKAIDDRAGCQILIDMIKSDMKYDTEFLFSVQEEIGLRGAGAGAYTINPDIAIVIETTTAADIDSSEGAERVCVLGEGPVILYRDRRTMYDRELYNLAVSVAEKNGIKWQTKTKVAGGNDSGSIQISRGGVKTLAVSVPCRYLHSPSTVMDMGDYELCEKLAEKLAEAVVEV